MMSDEHLFVPQSVALFRSRTQPASRSSIWLSAATLGVALLSHPALALDAPPATNTLQTALSVAPDHPTQLETLDLDWQDNARQRTVPARLYWPAASTATGQGKLPLIVFSHGLGGTRMGYSYLGRYWAQQGFASLHVQHQGSDRAVWGDGFFSMVNNLRNAASEENALARVQDVSFALDQVLSDPRLAPRIDAHAIAVAGHSYGANTAMLLAGAQVVRGGKVLPLRDERIKAAVLLSAPPFYNDGDTRQILGGMRIPTFHITGTQDIIRVPGYYSDAGDRVAVFEATGGPRKLLAVFKDATHSIFTDRMDRRATPELNVLVKQATKEVTTLFLKASLGRGDQEAPQRWLTDNSSYFSKVAAGL